MAVPNFGTKIQTREGRLYYKIEKCYGTTTLGPEFPLHIHTLKFYHFQPINYFYWHIESYPT